MNKIIFIFCLFPFLLHAQNEGVKVFLVDPNIDSTSIDKKYEVKKNIETSNVLPDRGQREKVLSEANLPKDWDELSKDIFFMDLKKKSVKELVKKYPDFKEADLKELKGKIK